MSLQSQLTRMAQNVGALNADTNAIFDALRANGVDVPQDATLDDVAELIERWPSVIYATKFNQIATGQFGAVTGSASIASGTFLGTETNVDTTFGFNTDFGVFDTNNMTNSTEDVIYRVPRDTDDFSVDYFIKKHSDFTSSFIMLWVNNWCVDIVHNLDSQALIIGTGWNSSFNFTTYNGYSLWRSGYGFYKNDDILKSDMHHVAAVLKYNTDNTLTIKQYVDGVLSLIAESTSTVKHSTISIAVQGNKGYPCQAMYGRFNIRNYDASINNGANFPIPTTDL